MEDTEKTEVTETPSTEKERKPRKPRAVRETPPVAGVEPSIIEEQKPKKTRVKKKGPVNVQKVAKQIEGVHAFASIALGPDFALDNEEATLLAESIVALAEEYDIVPSGKSAAWIGLLTACAMVYGPRVPGLLAKVKELQKRKSGQIVQIKRDETSPS